MKPAAGDPPHLQLGEQLAERADEPRRGRAASPSREASAASSRSRAKPAENGLGEPGAADGLGDQPREALDAHAHRRLLARQLAQVVLGVGARRDDQQRLLAVSQVTAHGVEHHLCLARVRGSGDERDRHATPILAHRARRAPRATLRPTRRPPRRARRRFAGRRRRPRPAHPPADAACRPRLLLGLGRLGALLGPRLVELDAPFALLGLAEREMRAEAAAAAAAEARHGGRACSRA